MGPVYMLHLSDFHISSTGVAEDRQMTKALCDKLTTFRDERRISFDLLIVSGDLVHHGAGEYDPVHNRLEAICTAAGLGKDQVFLVPGNHDVVRKDCSAPLYAHVVRRLRAFLTLV